MASISEETKLGKLHWPLILCVTGIAGLGVWNLKSAGRSLPTDPGSAQLTWLIIGAAIVAVTLVFDYRVLRALAWPVYIVTLLMLALVYRKGVSHHGAQRWLQFGSVAIQPSEFAKIAVILMLARHFGDNPVDEKVVRNPRSARIARWFRQQAAIMGAWWRKALAAPPPPMRPVQPTRVSGYALTDLWWPFLIILVPVVMVVKQPDLGTGLVTMAVGCSLILFAGLRPMTLLSLLGGAAGASVLAWRYFMKPYQKDRIEMFLDPSKDALHKGYHAIQSIIAVGSGQMTGKGWGNGTQNQLSFLPEQHTDFAFPVWAEEHGFVGSVIMVVLFMLLVLFALDIASNARDRFGAYLTFGAAALFFWHAFINIGMVTGVLPVVGVPLLLVSYGGSSAVLTLLCVGVLLNVALRRNQFQ